MFDCVVDDVQDAEPAVCLCLELRLRVRVSARVSFEPVVKVGGPKWRQSSLFLAQTLVVEFGPLERSPC